MNKIKLKKLVKGVALSAVIMLTTVISSIAQHANLEVTALTQSESYSWQNVNIGGGGGFVPGIIYNPTEEGLVYCRTDMGGVYRRDKETQRWIPLTDWVSPDEWNLLGGESIATDPVETNRVYVAAGTYTNSWTNMNGYILRSDDYGDTWERTELPFKFGGNMPGRSAGERLAIDPNSNNIIYFAARSGNGLWKSVDYGETWNRVESFTNVGNYVEDPEFEYSADNLGLTWVTFDSAKTEFGQPTQNIYVGVADKENPIYKSSDGGKTWVSLEGQPTAETFTKHNSEALDIGIPHHGVIATNGMLYITYGDRGGPYQMDDGAIYKYNTNTGEWAEITPPSGVDWDGNPQYELYYGFGGIAVDANNPDVIVTASLQSWWPDNYLFRSTDGGETWDSIWKWDGSWPTRNLKYTMDISDAPWLSWGGELNSTEGGLITGTDAENPTPKIGWMMGDLEINPFDSDEMMYGTGATILGCDNLTDWDKGEYINLRVKGMGIEETAVLSLMCPPVDGVELISGLGDICGFVHKDITVGPDCMMIGPAFTNTTGMDYAELNPNYMVRVGAIDKEQYEELKFSVASSSDGGETWSAVTPNLSYIVPPVDDEEIAEGGVVAVSADGESFVWAPNNYRVVSYVNGGWNVVDSLPNNAYVCSDRVNPNVFYAYADSTFYVSNDGGLTFTAKEKIEDGPETAKIKAVPDEEGHVWIPGSSTGMWYTTNGGEDFTKVDGIKRSDVVGFGKAKAGADYLAIYAVCEIDGVNGVYRSDDMAKTWIRVNDDEHQYGSINYAITGDLRVYGRVFVGTNGRGVVYGELMDAEEKTSEVDGRDPNPSYNYNRENGIGKGDGTDLGDVNCDGYVDSFDISAIKYAIIQEEEIEKYITAQGAINAEIDKDGAIDSDDLKLLKQLVLGAIDSFE